MRANQICIHAVIEANDTVLRDDAAHVAHQSLRCHWKTVLIGAIGEVFENAFSQRQERPRIRELALQFVPEKLQRWAEISNNLAVREVDSSTLAGV